MNGVKRLGSRFLTDSDITGFLFEGDKICVETHAGRIYSRWVDDAGAWEPTIGRMANVRVSIIPRLGHLLVSKTMPRIIQGDVLYPRCILFKLGKTIVSRRSKHDGVSGASRGKTTGRRRNVHSRHTKRPDR